MHDFLPKSKTDLLSTDLKDMYELEPADRYSFVRSIMGSDELYNLSTYTDPSGIACHYIRDVKVADELRLVEAPFPDVFQAGDHVFMRLEQCKIIEIKTTKLRPYLRANLSECSSIIARDEERLWAAHLGMSQVSQLDNALEQLHYAGFEEKDCVVVASVGKVQETSNVAGYSPRLASKQAYIDRGFNPATITTFEYIPPTSPDDRLHHNFCEVIIGTDGQLITTFDAETYFRHGSMRENIHADTLKEIFIGA